MRTSLSIFLLSLLGWACQQKPAIQADLIITNAMIWTGNPDQPEANALAILDGKIMAVGDSTLVQPFQGKATEVLNAEGAFITPGFIDAHVHFLTGGMNLASVQLRDAKTPEIFSQRLAEFAQKIEPGEWITGGEWDHENWGGALPTKDWIDDGTSENPVFISRLDGHMALLNSKAMQLAGIDKNTADMEGGEIVRDASGEPTGILKDNAMGLMDGIIPAPTPATLDRALEASMHYVAAQGVTSVHHVAGSAPAGYMAAFERAHDEGRLITRIYVMSYLSNWGSLAEKIKEEGKGDEWLKIGGLKGFIDGSLGSHTAFFKEPYTDAPNDKGLFLNNPDSLEKWIQAADAADLQVAVHAIGDSAIQYLLNVYEKVSKENGPKDRRFRIEHAQHIAPEDIPRFAELAVIPSMQPYHAIDDGRWAEKLIGPERAKTTYAFKSLLDANAYLTFGSDWYVAPPTPLEGIYAAVSRRTLDGKNPNGWVSEQKITVEQALVAYTSHAAYAAFDESQKGSLEPGKLADLVFINEDIRQIAPEKIRNAKILKTIVGGKIVFEQN